MQNPIEANNMAEIERRVVLPVVQALLRDGELDQLHLRTDAPDDEWPWPEAGSVWLWFSARGEVYSHRLVPDLALREGTDEADEAQDEDADGWDSNLEDAQEMAADLYDDLRDWLSETKLSWGELRDGDYDIPLPATGG